MMSIGHQDRALLIIDVQNDFCETGFAYEKSGRDITPIRTMVKERLLPFLMRWRSACQRSIFICAHYPRDKFLTDGFPELCVAGTEGAALFLIKPDSLSSLEALFFKSELDAFSNPELDSYLRAHKVDRVLISGVTTDKCVKASISGALKRGYAISVLRDLVAAAGHRVREHRDVLSTLEQQGGIEVVTSTEIERLFWGGS